MLSVDSGAKMEQSENVNIENSPHKDEKIKSQSEEMKVKPPDGGYGWWIVAGAAITHFFLVGMARCLGVVYITLKKDFGGTDVQTAWVAAIFNTCRSLFAPIGSFFCERLSCRIVTLVGSLVLVIGFFCSAFATRLFHLYITFGFAGIGGAMVFTPAYIMVGKYFDKRKGKAMAFATLGSGLGSIILAPAVNGLLHYYTLYGTMIIIAGLQLHHLIPGMLYIPIRQNQARIEMDDTSVKKQEKLDQVQLENDTDIRAVLENESETPDIPKNETKNVNIHKIEMKSVGNHDNEVTAKSEEEFTKEALLGARHDTDKDKSNNKVTEKNRTVRMKLSKWKEGSLICNGTFILYGIVIMSMQVCIQTFLIFLPGFALEKGVSDREAALVLSIFGFSDMGGRFLFGFFFDLRQIRDRRRDFFCLVSGIFGGLVILMSFMSEFILVCIVASVTGLFEGATHSQRTTVLSEFVTASQMSSAVGIIIFFQGLGNIYGPPLGGYFSDISGTNAYAFIFCGSMMLGSSLIFLLQNWISKRCCRHYTPEVRGT